MPYIGHEPTNSGNFYILDDFNGLGQDGSSNTYDQNANGTIVNFKLMVAGVAITPNVDNLIVTIDGVLQHPTDAYTISGSILTFTEAPASGVDFHVVIMGQSSTVGEGSIGADELKISGNGTNNQLLKTDGDGTFSYINQNTVTASTAATLATARAINGVNFDGSSDITVTAAAGTLTGNTLASGVTASSLTSVGTLTGLTVNSNLLTLSHSSLDTRLKIEASASNRAGILQLLGGSSDKVAIDFGQSGGTGDLGRIRYDISSNTMNFINGDHSTPELILSTSSATFAGTINSTIANTQTHSENTEPNSTTEFLTLHNNSGSDGAHTDKYVTMKMAVGGGGTSEGHLIYRSSADNQGEFIFNSRHAGSTYNDILTLKSDKSATFAGDVTVDGDRYMLTESGTNKGFFGKDDWATSGGNANDVNVGSYSGTVKLTAGGASSSTSNIVCNTDKSTTFANGTRTQGGAIEQYAISGGGRSVRIIRQETGTYTGDFTIECSATSWKSVIYKVTVAGHNGSADWRGMFYWNSGETSHSRSLEDYNGEVGNLALSAYSGGSGNQGFKLVAPLGSTGLVHPIAIVEIISGGGYVLSNDEITVDFT